MQQSILLPSSAASRGADPPSSSIASFIRRSGRRPAPAGAAQLLLTGALALCMALLSACNTSRQAARGSRLMPDTPTVSQTPPTADTIDDEPTIGEQLGRLDALMKTAPADSLPILEAEYQRLLDLAAQGDRVQTGGVEPDEDAYGEEPRPIVSTPRRDLPAGEMKGFRTTELKGSGRGEAPPAEPRSHVSTPRRASSGSAPVAHVSTPRRSGAARASSSRTASSGSSTPRATTGAAKAAVKPAATTGATSSTAEARPTEATSNQRDRKFINGLAASRAGHYTEAANELPTVVASPPPGKKALAGHAYGEALEKTGNTAKASEQYQKNSKGSDELNHKSYLAYCRTVAKSGDRARARKLLVQFIEKNPKSSQVVNARQLLQTL